MFKKVKIGLLLYGLILILLVIFVNPNQYLLKYKGNIDVLFGSILLVNLVIPFLLTIWANWYDSKVAKLSEQCS